jgi:hypothetical protein
MSYVNTQYLSSRTQCKILCFVIFTLAIAPMPVFAKDPNKQSLFHIERNTNANIVQYDVQTGSDGKLYKKEPVRAYWIRLAHEGQVKELSWIQKEFAYGFDADFDSETDTVVLEMAADLGRDITVQRAGEVYRATITIDGKSSYLDKLFIHATGKGLSTEVDYIDLYGKDVNSSADTYERFVP